ncbi:MAG TPA: MlaD family protein [Kofleriaceae bacterium]|nr:MlaD family protein [Kofleriaceae bacterium]
MSLLAQDEVLVRRVGFVSLGVLALAIVFFVFVFDRIEWGKHVRVRVYFHATGGLAEDAPFVVAGRAVGRVESIALSPHGAPGPLGGDAGVVATVAIDAKAARELHVADVFVASRGPLSGKYLELGPAEPGAAPLRDGSELRGADPPTLDRVLERTWDNLTTVKKFGDELAPEFDALRAQLDQLRANLRALAPDVPLGEDVAALYAEAGRTYDALGDAPGLARIGALAGDARATIAQARGALVRLGTRADALSQSLAALRGRMDGTVDHAIAQAQLALDRVRAAIARLDPLLADVDAISASLAAGDGSLMRLMHDPEFPEDAKELGKILKRQPWKVIDHPTK